MKTSDFDYHLPEELIAQHPASTRTGSRLLHLDGKTGTTQDLTFTDIVSMIEPNDIIIFNDTKVIKARLHGAKESGGSVEALVERILPDGNGDSRVALAHLRASKSPKPGSRIRFAKGDHSVDATMVQRVEDLFELHFDGDKSVYEILDEIGDVPLPPYITHDADAEDQSRYQTVYAKHEGSVAAPTAGLHFDEDILAALKQRGASLAYVTLHVGAGTFRPVRDDDISKHVMHSEWYRVTQETVDGRHDEHAHTRVGGTQRHALRRCRRDLHLHHARFSL
jgi:S-adenosylmethionine:tRNA ribosyltransferase-isomerase